MSGSRGRRSSEVNASVAGAPRRRAGPASRRARARRRAWFRERHEHRSVPGGLHAVGDLDPPPQRLLLRAGGQEPSAAWIRESVHRLRGQGSGVLQVHRVAGRLEQLDEPVAEEGEVVEHGRAAGLLAVRASSEIAARVMVQAPDGLCDPLGSVTDALLTGDSIPQGQGSDRKPIPGGDHLGVVRRLWSPTACVHELRAGAVPKLDVGRLWVLARAHCRDVGALEVSGLSYAQILDGSVLASSTVDRRIAVKEQLRKRVAEELELSGTPLNTRVTYLRCIQRFERHFGRSAASLGKVEGALLAMRALTSCSKSLAQIQLWIMPIPSCLASLPGDRRFFRDDWQQIFRHHHSDYWATGAAHGARYRAQEAAPTAS